MVNEEERAASRGLKPVDVENCDEEGTGGGKEDSLPLFLIKVEGSLGLKVLEAPGGHRRAILLVFQSLSCPLSLIPAGTLLQDRENVFQLASRGGG